MTMLGRCMMVLTTLLVAPPTAAEANRAFGTSAAYHELTDNRATLVLRDQTHLSVTMYIDFTGALHRTLAPQRSETEFVLTYAAMSPTLFRDALRRAQAHFMITTQVQQTSGDPVVLRNWTWPDAAAVQTMLQQQAMQTVVAPLDHAHGQPLEIHADAIAAQPIRAVTIRFPGEFARVLVVSYTPNQVWVDPTMRSPRITF